MAKKVTDIAELKTEAAEAAKVAAKKTAKTAEKVAAKAEKTVEKAVEKTENAVKKTAAKCAKKAEAKVTYVVQFAGSEYTAESVLAAAKADYEAANKDEIKDITLYIKPEDKAAYYVVNGKVSGKVSL